MDLPCWTGGADLAALIEETVAEGPAKEKRRKGPYKWPPERYLTHPRRYKWTPAPPAGLPERKK